MNPTIEADLKNRFNYHAPDEAARSLHQAARNEAGSFAAWIASFLPESREKSLALTKLEEAMFWANAAIARHDDGGQRR